MAPKVQNGCASKTLPDFTEQATTGNISQNFHNVLQKEGKRVNEIYKSTINALIILPLEALRSGFMIVVLVVDVVDDMFLLSLEPFNSSLDLKKK